MVRTLDTARLEEAGTGSHAPNWISLVWTLPLVSARKVCFSSR